MRLESLPKTKRLVQSDITNALVRQLTSLLNIDRHRQNHKLMHKLPKFQQLMYGTTKEEITLRTQNTKATGCCDQWKPSLQEVGPLFALLPMEQIVQNACTLKTGRTEQTGEPREIV